MGAGQAGPDKSPHRIRIIAIQAVDVRSPFANPQEIPLRHATLVRAVRLGPGPVPVECLLAILARDLIACNAPPDIRTS